MAFYLNVCVDCKPEIDDIGDPDIVPSCMDDGINIAAFLPKCDNCGKRDAGRYRYIAMDKKVS